MKQKLKKSVSVLMASVLLVLSFTTVAGARVLLRIDPEILPSVERRVLTFEEEEGREYVPLQESTVGAEALVSNPAVSGLLSCENSEIKGETAVTAFWDTTFERKVNRLDTETAQIEFDQNNNLVRYTNLEDLDGDDRLKLEALSVMSS